MDKYWLIRYGQSDAAGNMIYTNEVIDIHPADWFFNLLTKFPHEKNELLWSMEISEEQYNRLHGLVG